MSTRAHIIVKDKNSTHYVYHHCDGYPEGVGKDLKEIFIPGYIEFYSKGEIDLDSGSFCTYLENSDSEYEYEDSGIHGDEEYIYHITIDDGSINFSVDSVSFSGGSKRLTEFTEVFEVPTRDTGEGSDIDSMTEILSGIVSEFFRSPEGKRILKKSITKYFDKNDRKHI